MMEKTGELRAQKSRCDHCAELATVVVGERAYCASCAQTKQAAADCNVKSSAPALSKRYKQFEAPPRS